VTHEVQPAEPDDCRGHLPTAAFLSVVLARRIDACRFSIRVVVWNGFVFVRSHCSFEPVAPGTKAMKIYIRDLFLVTVIGFAPGCYYGPVGPATFTPTPSLQSSLVGNWRCISDPTLLLEFSPSKFVITDSDQNLKQVCDCKYSPFAIVVSNSAIGEVSLLVNVVSDQEIVIGFGDGKKQFERQGSVLNSSAPAPNPPKP
jgi:hypothetical protein